MNLPSEKYLIRRKKAFERLIGQLLAEVGETSIGDSCEDILKILEGKSFFISTQWGKATLPELMPLLRKEVWSPDKVMPWYVKYCKKIVQREKKRRNRQIEYLIEYIAYASNRLLKDAEDTCKLLKSIHNNTFSLTFGFDPEEKTITAKSALIQFNQLTIEEIAKVLKNANKIIKNKDKEFRDELIAMGRLGIITKSHNEIVKCPICTNNMLRGWESKQGTIALCYECGALFECNTGNIISQFEGNPEIWGAKALAKIAI